MISGFHCRSRLILQSDRQHFQNKGGISLDNLKRWWRDRSSAEKIASVISFLLVLSLACFLIFLLRKWIGYALIFALIWLIMAAPDIEEQLEKRFLGASASCSHCVGCNTIYSLANQIVFQAARQCDVVGIRPPRSQTDVQTVCAVPPSGYVCFYFVLLHIADNSQKHPLEAVQAFLTRRILDASQAYAQYFYDIPVKGLYLDSIVEADEHTYTIRVVPICPFNTSYFEHRKRQISSLRITNKASNEVVYDDELQQHP